MYSTSTGSSSVGRHHLLHHQHHSSGSSWGAPHSRRNLLVAAAVTSVVLIAVLAGVLGWAVPRAHKEGTPSGLSPEAATLGFAPAAAAPAAGDDWATPGGLGGMAADAQRSGSPLDARYCDGLPDSAQRYCREYLSSPGSRRFSASKEWEQLSTDSFQCAGVDPKCILEDLESDREARSSCMPLAEGAQCYGTTGVCKNGLCSEEKWNLEQGAYSGPQTDKNGRILLQPGRPAPARPAAPARPVGKQAARKLPPPPPPPRPPPPPPPKPKPHKRIAPSGPVPAWKTYYTTVLTNKVGARVPETFLATSHEWDRIMDYAHNIKAFKNIFAEFGPSPILRMGGASQDAMTEPPSMAIWESLAVLHREFNARFLIGLPLYPINAAEMGYNMMKLAEQYLPKAAIMGYELGNEPEFWPTSVGGRNESNLDKFIPGFKPYAAYFDRVAKQLNPCPAPGQPATPKLSGPGWGNVNTIDAAWLSIQAKAPGSKCYMRELSVHYYPYVNNVTVDSKSLLSQELQNFGLEKFKWLKGVADEVKMQLRISETNSLYGGGRAGLSDTMAGTLWCADALFAFAHAGAAGFHFHWGFGGRPVHGGQPNTGVQTNFWKDQPMSPYPSVHAPWYAYLLFRTATAGADGGYSDTRFLGTQNNATKCKSNIKVWALASDNQTMRIVAMNKEEDSQCNVAVTVPSNYCVRPGNLSRLLAGPEGLDSKSGLTWRGQTYDDMYEGLMRFAVVTQAVPASPVTKGVCSYTIAMPEASGAVLELQSQELLNRLAAEEAAQAQAAAAAAAQAQQQALYTQNGGLLGGIFGLGR